MNLVDNDRGFGMFNSSPRSDMLKNSDQTLNSGVGGGKAPQYVIQSEDPDDMFDSDLDKDFAKTAPALWVELGGARLATYDSSGQLSGDGKVVCKDTIVCMKYGAWAPTIQEHMFKGDTIQTITIKRLISTKSTLVIIQQIDYAQCLFKTYEQAGDTITFSFCFTKLTDLSNVYDHTGSGAPLGSFGVEFDLSKMSVENKNS
jgi:hypothetical protein